MRLYLAGAVLGTILAFACGAPSAMAEVQVYYDRAQFMSALGSASPVVNESYESYATDAAPGARQLELDHFTVWYSPDALDSYFGVDRNDNPDAPAGVVATEGKQFIRSHYPAVGGPPTGATSFVFGSAVFAFGTDLRDVEAPLQYTLSDKSRGPVAGAAPSGEIQFFGVISTTPLYFVTIAAVASPGGDHVVFDRTIFVPVPEGCASLVGDLNGDCAVDAQDLAILLGAWGPCTGDCPADLSVGGAVEAQDLAILLGGWTG